MMAFSPFLFFCFIWPRRDVFLPLHFMSFILIFSMVFLEGRPDAPLAPRQHVMCNLFFGGPLRFFAPQNCIHEADSLSRSACSCLHTFHPQKKSTDNKRGLQPHKRNRRCILSMYTNHFGSGPGNSNKAGTGLFVVRVFF